MATLAELFHQACRRHQSGELALAENLCRQILQAEPRHVDAWHLLGLIAEQVGRHNLAVEYIGQALHLNPGFADAHYNLGVVLYKQGKLGGAEASYRQALRLQPGFAGAHYNLGVVLYELGKLDDAEGSYRQALRLNPDFAEAHNGLGNILRDQGKLTEAEASYRVALRLNPVLAEAHNGLGNVLHDQGNLIDAEASYRVALRLNPVLAEAHNGLGNVFHDQSKLEDAEASFREALRVNPIYADAHNNLGNVLHDQGRLEDAEASYRAALRLRPVLAEAHNGLGNILQNQGKLADAETGFHEAVRINPDYAEAHLNLGLNRLLQGDFAQGWPEFEWRRRTKDHFRDALPPPVWDGSALNGQTILLQTEYGVGDAIQFVRYARLVKAQGGRIVLQCQPALGGILATCPDIDQVVTAGTSLPPYHFSTSLMSLPLLCKTTLETIPADVPYLAAIPTRVAFWRARLAAIPGLKVGICWQGNPKLKRDRLRSVPLACFAPLAAVPGVSLIALQRGPGLEQIAQQSERLSIVDLPGRSEDLAEGWLDSAALIQALDLVISVDTAVTHLAGALGAPVWVTLPFVPDWRWFLHREDSPWYPTARLFRQQKPGDWPEVFERIALAMQHWVTAREGTAR